jgi:hypothetical protein
MIKIKDKIKIKLKDKIQNFFGKKTDNVDLDQILMSM